MSKCHHRFKTISTVSRRSHKEGSNKFKSGFEEADKLGIKILVARRQKCLECGTKRTTIEISKTQFGSIIGNLLARPEIESDDGTLSTIENEVRKYLISVSRGKTKTRHKGKAMYKEVWNAVYPNRQFCRANTTEVVDWIVNISNVDVSDGDPPLNSLVVRGDTGMPGKSWDKWREYSDAPFKNAEEAQRACWGFWK